LLCHVLLLARRHAKMPTTLMLPCWRVSVPYGTRRLPSSRTLAFVSPKTFFLRHKYPLRTQQFPQSNSITPQHPRVSSPISVDSWPSTRTPPPKAFRHSALPSTPSPTPTSPSFLTHRKQLAASDLLAADQVWNLKSTATWIDRHSETRSLTPVEDALALVRVG
jgi:hypothetical protein